MVRALKVKLDEAKLQFKDSIQKVDQKYKDMAKIMHEKLDKHHQDQVAQLVA